MASFLDNIDPKYLEACISDIQDVLYDNWMEANLEKGQMYADREFAVMASDSLMNEKFNEYYKLSPDDENYLEVH